MSTNDDSFNPYAQSLFSEKPETQPDVPSSSKTNHNNDHVANGSKLASSSSTSAIGQSSVSRLFEPSKDSYFSKDMAKDEDDHLDFSSLKGFSASNGSRSKKVQFSEKSKKLLEDSDRLLQSIPASSSASYSSIPRSMASYSTMPRRTKSSRSSSPEEELPASTSRFLLHTPRFPRIDFDDMLEEECQDKKPAWKQLQENIKSSYHKPKRTVERHKELNEAQDYYLNRYKRSHRSESPYAHLDGESFIPRAPSWYASGAMQPRGLNLPDPAGSGPYAAPHLSSSKGIESRPCSSSRYDRLVDDIEARLLKTSILPETMKTITRREFRQAPLPAAGSASEQYADEEDMMHVLPRPFYSRPNRLDKDYFDFDLQHSVDMYKKPEGRYFPRGPQPWENKLLSEAKGKGEATLSGHMFNQKGPQDWRSQGTSYLSAALRTPSFWEHRFTSIGTHVRDSNPISLTSIERNKPVPNKFTVYNDPDFADYEDPKDAD